MKKVLVADDEYLMQEALAQMISKIDGFEVVHSVDTGKEAVRICETEEIDIVFMDIMMPEMNGIEAGRRIKTINKEISIYILTAYNKLDYWQEALKMKAEEYLLKPVAFSRIEEILKRHLKKDPPPSETGMAAGELLKFASYREMYYGIPEFVKKIDGCGEDGYKEIVQSVMEIFKESRMGIRRLNRKKYAHKKEFEHFLLQSMDLVYRDRAAEKHPILKEVFGYLDDHLEENIGLKEITQSCNISQGYLSRIFKTEFGISVMEYIHMRKMMLAKWYFYSKNFSLTDVAYSLGYNESSYFCKVFKKYEHVTALQYKRSLNKEVVKVGRISGNIGIGDGGTSG